MDFREAVRTRRSVRGYTDEPVERDVIERILQVAGAAPSNLNSQPWRFHVCTGGSRARLGEIVARTTVHLAEYIDIVGEEHYQSAIEWLSSLGNAPVAIGVSAPVMETDFENTNALLSIGGAMEHLMLAAAAEGLGTCCVSLAMWVSDDLGELFSLAPERRVVSVITLGHPAPTRTQVPPRNEDIADWLG